jgi:hypothetical protein
MRNRTAPVGPASVGADRLKPPGSKRKPAITESWLKAKASSISGSVPRSIMNARLWLRRGAGSTMGTMAMARWMSWALLRIRKAKHGPAPGDRYLTGYPQVQARVPRGIDRVGAMKSRTSTATPMPVQATRASESLLENELAFRRAIA